MATDWARGGYKGAKGQVEKAGQCGQCERSSEARAEAARGISTGATDTQCGDRADTPHEINGICGGGSAKQGRKWGEWWKVKWIWWIWWICGRRNASLW